MARIFSPDGLSRHGFTIQQVREWRERNTRLVDLLVLTTLILRQAEVGQLWPANESASRHSTQSSLAAARSYNSARGPRWIKDGLPLCNLTHIKW